MKYSYILTIIVVFLALPSLWGKEKGYSPKNLSRDRPEQEIIQELRIIGKEKIFKATEDVAHLLDDTRVEVRVEAAAALGMLRQSRSLSALHQAFLYDENARVRYAALLAILQVGDGTSFSVLRKSYDREQDPYIHDLLEKLKTTFLGKEKK
jgi:hypothetical protein